MFWTVSILMKWCSISPVALLGCLITPTIAVSELSTWYLTEKAAISAPLSDFNFSCAASLNNGKLLCSNYSRVKLQSTAALVKGSWSA